MNAASPSIHAFDLVIAGGAMSGATLALAVEHLTQSGLKIAVVEAAIADVTHPGYDARSIALSYGSCLLLDSIGLWKKLSAQAAPINSVHVSDKGHFGLTQIHAKDENLPFLGAVIELSKTGQIFNQALKQSESITLFCPTSVAHIDRQIDHVTLTLNTHEQLKTKLFVAADGALSTCCDMLDIASDEHDFNQVALIANITTASPHQGRAFERFTHNGPLALLPLSQGRSSLVWCMPPLDAEKLIALDDAQFAQALQEVFGWRLGQIEQTGQRQHYPLILRQRRQLISHRFAVVGNAAQSLHPIAGQGFNLGLRDVITLAEEIARSYEQHADIGGILQLQRYLKRRARDRDLTIRLTSNLVHGFSNAAPLLVFGRNLGVMGLSLCPTLKMPFLKRAIGLVER